MFHSFKRGGGELGSKLKTLSVAIKMLKMVFMVSINLNTLFTDTGIPRYSALHLALFRYSALAYPHGSTVLRC
jgi:hypothetical protein